MRQLPVLVLAAVLSVVACSPSSGRRGPKVKAGDSCESGDEPRCSGTTILSCDPNELTWATAQDCADADQVCTAGACADKPATPAGPTGTAKGTWSGNCDRQFTSGTFEVTADEDGSVSGTFDGADSGTITGTIQPSGSLSASAAGRAGGCDWTGTLQGTGKMTGSGNWNCNNGCSGTWRAD